MDKKEKEKELKKDEIINCLSKFPYIHGFSYSNLKKIKREKLEKLLKKTYENYNKFDWSDQSKWRIYIKKCRSIK